MTRARCQKATSRVAQMNEEERWVQHRRSATRRDERGESLVGKRDIVFAGWSKGGMPALAHDHDE